MPKTKTKIFKCSLSAGWVTHGLEGVKGGIRPLMIESDNPGIAARQFVDGYKAQHPNVTYWNVLVDEDDGARRYTYQVEADSTSYPKILTDSKYPQG